MATRQLLENPDDIRLNEQDEIQQILGPPPRWMIRYGISVLFFFFVGLIALAFWIRYRDVVEARGFLTTASPPAKIIVRKEGRIVKLLVTDQETVVSGQKLAILESTADHEDILKLVEGFLLPMDSASRPGQVIDLDLPTGLQIGDLQSRYSTLREQLDQLRYQYRKDQTLQLISRKENEIDALKAVNQAMEQQMDTLRKEARISKNKVDTLQRLLAGGYASPLELRNAETTFLQYQRELRNKQIDLYNNQIQVSQLESSITNLSQGKDEKINELWIAFKEEIRKLHAELENWKQNYLLTAPIAGQVSFTNLRGEQQFVTAGTSLMTVVPVRDAAKIVALAFLPATGMGKVATNMEAKIRLDAYNYKEFGVLEGKVQQIGLAPESSQEGEPYFRMQVELPLQMVTSYGDTLQFKPEMTALVKVLTEERSLMARLLDRIWSWTST
ncbi:MAG: hypothetical protein DHS20C18_34980 [Saprospiraceae bacterium]|nr:MAG: hypothetical protein DHS20C18_34980 [Saprospiraceae bacterium]